MARGSLKFMLLLAGLAVFFCATAFGISTFKNKKTVSAKPAARTSAYGASPTEPFAQFVYTNTSFRVSEDFAKHLETLGPIPHKLHVFWRDKEIVDSKDEMILHGLRKVIDLNPGWEMKVWIDVEIDEYLQASKRLSKADKALIKSAHVVEKTDAFRLLLMYDQGGFYQDVDRVYNVPLESVLAPDTRLLLPTLYDTNFMQDIMCSSPGNNLFLTAHEIAWALRRVAKRQHGYVHSFRHLKMTNSWTTAIAKTVFGIASGRMDGQDLPQARAALEQRFASKKVILTRKSMWCDELLVTDYPGCKQVARDGLYRAYNITPWATEVDAFFQDDDAY